MDCDTFSDLPDVMHNPIYLNEVIFTPLRSFVGPVFTGLASQAYGLGDLDWGAEIQLTSTETLQMRMHPRGLLSAGKLMEPDRSRTIMVAVRRRGPVGKDHVVLAILWHGQRDKMDTLSPFDSLKTSTDCVATRNLHIFLPSLFSQHDAMYANRSKTVPKLPVLDTQNFHAVRPGSYSVHSMIKLPSGDLLRRVTAAPGHSQYVIAGYLAGVEIEDHMHPSVDKVPQSKWVKLIDECSAAVENKVGLERGLLCMQNSLHITDCLTAEGLLAVMSHNFSCGAMPDMLHVPGGFPLLIAFMVRLACYPKRFHLSEGHDVDRMANNEVISLFESNWEPIHPQKAGGRNIYAIDIAIRQAHTEARNAAKKLQKTEAPVEDNTMFWHRAGQRCVSAVFGAGVEEFVHPRYTFGLPEKLVDPLVEARNSVIRSKMDPVMAVTGTESVMSDLASVQERRNCLLQVLNSVEHWLRTGMYCGMQIHKPKPKCVNMRIKRPGGKNMLTRDMLRKALDKGVEDSVKQAVANGEANTIEEARAAAQVMRDGIEGALHFDADDQVDFNDISMRMPADVLNLIGEDGSGPSPEASYNIQERDFENVFCEEAMSHAVSMVSASMCSGSMVQLDLEVGCFLSSSTSLLSCADCDAEVHVLTAAFLATSSSRCTRCSRPRCLVCATAVHKKRKAPFGCLRCKEGDGSAQSAAVAVDAMNGGLTQGPAPRPPSIASPEKPAKAGKPGKAKGKAKGK
jgi:hypothetical protein